MAKFSQLYGHVRVRQLHGDRRLHITEAGKTTSGYLDEATFEWSIGDIPSLGIKLNVSEIAPLYRSGRGMVGDFTPFADQDTTETVSISADRILAADIAALDMGVFDNFPREQFEAVLKQMESWFDQDPAPACGHEDVTDVSEMGIVRPKGLCLWCPVPLILDDQGVWVPESK